MLAVEAAVGLMRLGHETPRLLNTAATGVSFLMFESATRATKEKIVAVRSISEAAGC